MWPCCRLSMLDVGWRRKKTIQVKRRSIQDWKLIRQRTEPNVLINSGSCFQHFWSETRILSSKCAVLFHAMKQSLIRGNLFSRNKHSSPISNCNCCVNDCHNIRSCSFRKLPVLSVQYNMLWFAPQPCGMVSNQIQTTQIISTLSFSCSLSCGFRLLIGSNYYRSSLIMKFVCGFQSVSASAYSFALFILLSKH